MSDNKKSTYERPGTQPTQSSAERTVAVAGMRGGFGNHSARFMRPTEKPQNPIKTIKRLMLFFKGQYSFIFVTFVLLLLSSATALAAPLYLGRAIDVLNGNRDHKLLSGIIMILASIYLCDVFAKFAQQWIIAAISQKNVRLIRKTLFMHLQKLPIGFFDSYTHGELMSRISNDTDNISLILGQAITQLMSVVIVLTGSIIMMLRLSPIMTLFSVVSIPLVFLLSKTISSNTRKLFKEQQAALGQLYAHIEENISGITIVKAYSHEKYSVAEFEEINERLRVVATKAQIWSGYIMPIMNVINNLSFAIVAGAGGYLAVNGMISVGLIATFINYSRQFGRPLNEVASTYNSIQSALASAERVFTILDTPEETADVPNAATLDKLRGDVEFKNVTFSYKKGEPVLKNVSFKVPAGSTVALVGPTGAGKTTIVNLVTRFYDVDDGEILLDGRNIKEYTRESLRRSFGIVLQDTYLFSGTIFENIKYGKETATDDEVVAAAKLAGANAFIKRLPDGYNTVLTESGQNLSQGQRQLLAIARAVLSDPKVLILDEATSSVDTRTELRIQEAMTKLMNGRTSFIIAHRLSTVIGADNIMVIRGGNLVECGKHSELINAGGDYARMFEMQLKGISIDKAEQER